MKLISEVAHIEGENGGRSNDAKLVSGEKGRAQHGKGDGNLPAEPVRHVLHEAEPRVQKFVGCH